MTPVSHEANARFLDTLLAWARSLLDHAVRHAARARPEDARDRGGPVVYEAEADHVRAFAEVQALPGIPYFQLAARLELRALDQLLVCLCLARARRDGPGAAGQASWRAWSW